MMALAKKEGLKFTIGYTQRFIDARSFLDFTEHFTEHQARKRTPGRTSRCSGPDARSGSHLGR